ncbi:uncharacterized protein LOC118751872, partial [Rhagoletis pomonella]|uniref:uncharacterized protein LOC118751872 n=1 Tax=Rhagoletis pomonella TaxID=28610 RepID=UPI00177D9DA5
MVTFLHRRCQTLENMTHAMVTQTPSAQATQKTCSVCNKHDHVIYSCPSFANLSPNDRWKESKRAQLCINCLKPGNHVQQCKSSACRRCSLKHHTLLHFAQTDQTMPSAAEVSPSPPQQTALVAMGTTSDSLSSTSHAGSNECVLLATAVVLIQNSAGSLVTCRETLDSASQLNFITTRLANQLQLKQ